jgi:hypothetical protein
MSQAIGERSNDLRWFQNRGLWGCESWCQNSMGSVGDGSAALSSKMGKVIPCSDDGLTHVFWEGHLSDRGAPRTCKKVVMIFTRA